MTAVALAAAATRNALLAQAVQASADAVFCQDVSAIQFLEVVKSIEDFWFGLVPLPPR
jgi:hypothetical protein